MAHKEEGRRADWERGGGRNWHQHCGNEGAGGASSAQPEHTLALAPLIEAQAGHGSRSTTILTHRFPGLPSSVTTFGSHSSRAAAPLCLSGLGACTAQPRRGVNSPRAETTEGSLVFFLDQWYDRDDALTAKK